MQSDEFVVCITHHVKEFTTKPTQEKLVVTRVICSTTGYTHKNKKEDTEIE